jgi:hypothetical protein
MLMLDTLVNIEDQPRELNEHSRAKAGVGAIPPAPQL